MGEREGERREVDGGYRTRRGWSKGGSMDRARSAEKATKGKEKSKTSVT